MRLPACSAGILLTALIILVPQPAAAQVELYHFSGTGNDALGSSVASGDVNGDGYPDLAIGASQLGCWNGPGYVDVFSGRDGSRLHHFSDIPLHECGELGSTLDIPGDLDLDGCADVLIGSQNRDSIWVHSGRDGALMLELQNPHDFGQSVSGTGDLNHDGVADFLVSSPAHPGPGAGRGAVFVYSGIDFALLMTVHGLENYDHLGRHVSGAGDVNADGVPDFLASEQDDVAYLFSGIDGSVLHTYPTSSWDVSQAGDLDADGFADVISGKAVYSGADGSVLFENHTRGMLRPAGDVNGDGRPELVQGDPDADSFHVYLADGTPFFSLRNSGPDSRFGAMVGAAGDVNRDGFDDVIAAGYKTYCDPFIGCSADAGQAWVIAGTDCPANSSNYGDGWPGELGVPKLGLSGAALICDTVTIIIGNSRSGASANAIAIVGLSTASIPTIYGGTLLVQPLVTVPLVLPSPGVNVDVRVPCDPALCGTAIYMQVLEFDPKATRGVSFTRGLEVVIGVP